MSLAPSYPVYHMPLKTLDFFHSGSPGKCPSRHNFEPTAKGQSITNQFVAVATLLGGSTETALGKGTCQV